MTADIETIIREIIGAHIEPPPSDHEPLQLDSIVLIEILEEIEVRCNIHIHPSDLIPEHFSTVEQMIRFFQTK